VKDVFISESVFYDTADHFTNFHYSFSLSDLQERKKKEGEENRNNMQQQLQAKAQGLRYEDELARKRMRVLTSLPPTPIYLPLIIGVDVRMKHDLIKHLFWQTELEAQRKHDAELVKMQEASALRKEQARRATEQKMLEQVLQAQKEKAERDRETNKAKAYAEGEARAHAKILSEDVDRQLLVERLDGEKEKWLVAVNTTFSHIEGFHSLLLEI
jgi:ATPase family AAA domain-containing protein 3A/B